MPAAFTMALNNMERSAIIATAVQYDKLYHNLATNERKYS